MNEINELLKDIEKLRENLHKLIIAKNIDLQDPEIVEMSQTLNQVITRYNQLIENKTTKWSSC